MLILSLTGCGSTKQAVVSPRMKGKLYTMNLAITESNYPGFSDEMTMQFVGMGINVVDRNHVSRILEEHSFSQTGLTDPDSRQEIGKLLGANALCVLDFHGKRPRANVKVIDVETGSILISASYSFTGGFVPNHIEVAKIVGNEIRDELGL